MATASKEQALLALMAASEVEMWDSPADLARSSIEGLWRGGAGVREQRSAGTISLTGDGVEGSVAAIGAIGEIMVVLQRLVSSTGASIRGFKSLKGPFGIDIRTLTQLNLRAAPAQGSILLFVEPRSVPADELTDAGQVMLIEQPVHQFIDECIGSVFELLTAGKALGPDIDTSDFLAKVIERGPRVAAALRDFAKDVRDDSFDFEFKWEEPGQATRRIFLSSSEAQRISEVVVSRELDRDNVEIEGILRTVSDVGPLVIELEGGGLETLKTAELDHEVIVGLHVGDFARFDAEMQVVIQPGGVQKISYSATAYRGSKP
ncbi:hypothetical protein [Cryobacterium sp. PH31-O1]|uniref:hypothetical protein n=1 Tax=Cryobacterium sp. PH31-O1 TaxID=3046306 RepID=UPI0024BB275D|nr:hypothetical protein [Cryobacterium sp. PH31-O1]MDJ0337926.1 hypothetical protein [Cryobacterium sp. PH31-O1]